MSKHIILTKSIDFKIWIILNYSKTSIYLGLLFDLNFVGELLGQYVIYMPLFSLEDASLLNFFF
jgi:hypothetical protein